MARAKKTETGLKIIGTDGGMVGDSGMGIPGPQGPPGPPGQNGVDGQNGTNGVDGKSAFESAVSGGYTGTESEFNTTLANTIISMQIDKEVVITFSDYEVLKNAGEIEPKTAYNLIAG
jgi:Collagen triple helix repeat (20 copies).